MLTKFDLPSEWEEVPLAMTRWPFAVEEVLPQAWMIETAGRAEVEEMESEQHPTGILCESPCGL